MKRFSLIFVLFVWWELGAINHQLSAADVYQGQVVDEDTGEPLVGAVVIVIWYRSPIIQLAGSKFFHSAQETVTDSQGKFFLLVSVGTDWSPLTYVIKEPQVIIFQPGYDPVRGGWIARQGFQDTANFVAVLKKGAVLKLSKLESKEKLRYFSDVGSVVHPDVSNERIPKLIEAFNVQRKNLGFQPVPLRK